MSNPAPEADPSLAVINASQLLCVGDVADPKTADEEEEIAKERQRAEVAGLRQDTGERKRYAARIFWLCALWLFGIYALLLLDGFRVHGFGLPENVKLAFIGATTVNIIGIFYIVARYLFSKK